MSSSKKLICKGRCGRCIWEFIEWRYIQSCWYFRPSFVNCCPSPFLSGSTLPLPCMNKDTIYTYTLQCVRGVVYGVLGLRHINTCRNVPLQVNFVRWRHFALSSMSLIFLRLWPNGRILIKVYWEYLLATMKHDRGLSQGWKKPGFFKKNPAQWVFLGFLGFFGFFWVFLPRREGF